VYSTYAGRDTDALAGWVHVMLAETPPVNVPVVERFAVTDAVASAVALVVADAGSVRVLEAEDVGDTDGAADPLGEAL